MHFAQINQRDGFFIAGRRPDPGLRLAAGWKVRASSSTTARQPLAMLKYALHKQGVDYAGLDAIDAGAPDAMVAAFRRDEGDYIHLQGPAPQQLEQDGVGPRAGRGRRDDRAGRVQQPVRDPRAGSRPTWPGPSCAPTPSPGAGSRAARPAAVAKAEAPFFQDVDEAVLARTIAAYQRLGCWQGPLEIPRDAYEVALDVFQHSGLITRRHPYDAVVVPPPAG